MFLYKILFSLWGFLEIIIVVISLFGNSIVIYVMSREKKLRKKSSFYIVSLAVADLLTCVFTIVMTVMRSFKFLDHEYEFPVKLCYVLNSLLLMLTTVSIFQLVFVAADRYWAVCLPISYHRRTPRFAKFIICLCWLIGLTFGLCSSLVGQLGSRELFAACHFSQIACCFGILPNCAHYYNV